MEQPVRRQGREFTEAVERLAAGGVVFIPLPLQNKQGEGDKNNVSNPTPNPTTQERKNIMMDKTDQPNGGNTNKHHDNDGALGALETLARVIGAKIDKNEPVVKVTTTRTIGEKTIDTGLLCGAIVVGGTAVCAIGRFVFGIGKAPKAVLSIPAT